MSLFQAVVVQLRILACRFRPAAGWISKCANGPPKDTLQPYPAEQMGGWPVSRGVNDPKADEPELRRTI